MIVRGVASRSPFELISTSGLQSRVTRLKTGLAGAVRADQADDLAPRTSSDVVEATMLPKGG
jgi:hypothetical protein